MALLKFELPKELAPLRVKIARSVHDRVERYRQFCGALVLADLVKRALVYVMAKGCGLSRVGKRRRSVSYGVRRAPACEQGYPRQ